MVATPAMLGFAKPLLNPLGPVQFQVGVPENPVVAERFKVPPLHTGPLLETAGAEGGLGSARLTGPTVFEGQLFSET